MKRSPSFDVVIVTESLPSKSLVWPPFLVHQATTRCVTVNERLLKKILGFIFFPPRLSIGETIAFLFLFFSDLRRIEKSGKKNNKRKINCSSATRVSCFWNGPSHSDSKEKQLDKRLVVRIARDVRQQIKTTLRRMEFSAGWNLCGLHSS